MTPAQTNSLALRFGKSRAVIAVASIADASAKWGTYRDAHGLGASESPRVTVIDTYTGQTVAQISYNGRAWDKNGQEIQSAKESEGTMSIGPHDTLPNGARIMCQAKRGIVVSSYTADNRVVVHTVKLIEKWVSSQTGWRPLPKPITLAVNYSFIQTI